MFRQIRSLLFLALSAVFLSGATCGDVNVFWPVQGYDGNWKLRYPNPAVANDYFVLCIEVHFGEIVSVQNGCTFDTVITSKTPLAINEFGQLTLSARVNYSIPSGETGSIEFSFSGAGDTSGRVGTGHLSIFNSSGVATDSADFIGVQLRRN